MKILYGIQLNGNGHITRSLEIIRCLKDIGLNVDILVSGKNSNIKIPHKVKYRFTGLSIYYTKNGYVDWTKTFFNLKLVRLFCDIKRFSVKEYDLVISDFEPITAWVSKLEGVRSLGISNQSTLLLGFNKRNSFFSKFFIKHFSPCSKNINLHYQKSDVTVHPVIDDSLLKSVNKRRNKILIYLPSISTVEVLKKIRGYKNTSWVIFTDEVEKDIDFGYIQILKIDRDKFKKNILSCYGVITASGFSTTSESLVLNKKLWSIPLKGQWEQKCNSDFLKEIGVFTEEFTRENLLLWLSKYNSIDYKYQNPIPTIIEEVFNLLKN